MLKKSIITKMLVLFLITLFMISCVDEPNDIVDPSLIPIASLSATNTPSIDIQETELVINFYDYNKRNKEDIESFTDIVKERFGVDLNLLEIPPEAFSIVGESLDGIISMANYEYSELYQRKWSLFQPLNDYLVENEAYQSLPSEYKRSLKDDLGLIWCLPRTYDVRMNVRAYSEVLLDELDIITPKTIDELTEYFIKVRALGRNIVNVKSTSSSCLTALYDIVEVYGLEIQNYSTIIYSNSSHKYEDSIYNADLIDLLGYIRFLQDNEYLVIDDDWKPELNERKQLLLDGSLATYTTSISYMGAPSEKYSYSLLNNRRKIILEMADTSMIFLGKDTENPSEVLNSYLNTFYRSNAANILGTYGESGYRAIYSDSDNVEILKMDYEQIVQDVMKGKFPYVAGICGTGYYNDYFRYSEGTSGEVLKASRKAYLDHLEYRNKGFKEGLFDILSPLKETSDRDRMDNMDVFYLFKNMLSSYLNNDISINDFLFEYESTNKKLGQAEYISRLNEKLLGN